MKVEIDGVETEVYTAAEVAERETAARTAAEGEWKPKFEDVSGKLTKAEEAAAARAVEFGQFRKLSEDQVKQLSEKDAIIYANQLALQAEREKFAAADKLVYDSTVDTAIRKLTGSDQKLFDETRKMYELVGLDDASPDAITQRAKVAFAGIAQTQPDLLSAAGFSASGGSFEPPKAKEEAQQTYATTDAGKDMAKKLGLDVPEKK